MERICPFLALESDGHAVVAGYDPEHSCGALLPQERVDRARQLATCLEAAHRACPRYLAAMQVRADGMPWAPPAPDTNLLSTRLVLGPESALRVLTSGARTRPRRLAVGAALAVAGIVAVAGGVLGALGSLGEPVANAETTASPVPSQPEPETPAPAIGGRPDASVPAPTPVATPRPEPAETGDAPSSAPALPPADDGPRTYVVREGDTLGAIASTFGTSIEALMGANDLEDSDVILIGQELVIP